VSARISPFSRTLLGGISGLFFLSCAAAHAAAVVADAVLVPASIPTDRPAHDELTAALRSRAATLGLNGIPSSAGASVSRALVLLPSDRAQAGVVSFELEEGPDAGPHQCEALGRGVTSRSERAGWVRGVIAGTTVYYAPMTEPDGASVPGVYDAGLISPERCEVELLNSPADLAHDADTKARVASKSSGRKPCYSGVWKHWYSRTNAAVPIDLRWSETENGSERPVFERRPEAASAAAKSRMAKQLSRDPRYYVGPYGRSGFALHTDRWEDPERLNDPSYAGKYESRDFRFRDTNGCVKVRPACLLLLDEFVSEQERLGRRVQFELRETPLLD
jgi:hypothetical protein